jgi:uncharacterized protein YjbI with pentapeptide repeats
MTVDTPPSVTTAERALIEAIHARSACDLIGDDAAAGDMSSWDEERHIRATFLGRVLEGKAEQWGIDELDELGLRLQGAVICGDLWLQRRELPPIRLEGCRFDGMLSFRDTVFSGLPSFDGSTFNAQVDFSRATFRGDYAFFRGATFIQNAAFVETVFESYAVFDDAVFLDCAGFRGATFCRADFFGATVVGTADFSAAKFSGPGQFSGACADKMVFDDCEFSAPDQGPWTASNVSLRQVVVAERCRIGIAAKTVEGPWLTPSQGVRLVVHSPRMDLSDAEFARPTIISRPSQEELDELIPAARCDEPTADPPLFTRIRPVAAVQRADKFRKCLAAELHGIPPQCGITSLARATVNELNLIDVDLRDCEFLGAAGLDKLRLGGEAFKWTPRWWRYGPMTRRRIIAEEQRWRDAHAAKHGTPTRGDQDSFVPGTKIAEIYRQLRKGLEDAKNEPGAADFYYGEMEMRRLAARKPTGTDKLGGWSGWIERALLHGYWAVSGYGLRASRAIALLAATIVAAAVLYTHPLFASVTPPPPRIQAINPATGAVTYTQEAAPTAPRFSAALEYSARESISLFQARQTSNVEAHGPGTVLDFALRILCPVLLAFAVLALRGRTKR